MNPKSYRLSPQVLDEMRDYEYRNMNKRWENIYDSKLNGKSPSDRSQAAIDNLFLLLSEPLKRMQSEVLSNASRSCYKDRHLSDNFTNWEQISLCKEEEREKVFGNFDKFWVAHRNSDRFRFQDCIVDAGNDVEKAVLCTRNYIEDIHSSNAKIVE